MNEEQAERLIKALEMIERYLNYEIKQRYGGDEKNMNDNRKELVKLVKREKE